MSVSTRTTFTRTAALMLVAASGIGGAAASSAATSTTNTASTTGAVKGRAQIPWASVGDGWLAASSVKNGANTLVLVAPSGQTYSIMTLRPHESVTAVAHNGRHVVVTGGPGAPARVIDVAAGKASASLPGGRSYTFTRPAGTNVMTIDSAGRYYRYDTAGHLKNTSHLPGLTSVAMSPAGKMVAANVRDSKSGRKKVMIRSYTSFGPQRILAMPKGFLNCEAKGWANASTLTVRCTDAQDVAQMFSQKATGGTPTPLTKGLAPGDSPSGWYDAVSTSIGRVGIPASAAAPDLPTNVFVFKGTTATTRIAMPKFNPTGGDFADSKSIVGLYGNKALLATPELGYESTKRSVGQYDLVTKKLNYLIGNNSQFGGLVTGYTMIDPRN